MFKRFIASVLELIYEAAALCINVIRTFNLIVLSILGPLVFRIVCVRWIPAYSEGMAGEIYQYILMAAYCQYFQSNNR